MNSLNVSGFTIVRNARRLAYPFPESVLSVLPFCDEFIINCGDSEDQSWEICESLKAKYPDKIRLIRSRWEKEAQSGGFQLKCQTDRALREARGKWCFYIQADEAVHEADFAKLRLAMQAAETRPEVDGIVFDYLHFYGSYDYLVKGRNWYRREVRLFKNHRGIEAFKDAQGFRKNGERLRAIASNGRVFHYGYVRSLPSLKTKVSEMSQWWGENPNLDSLKLKRLVGIRRYTGDHPAVMNERIAAAQGDFNPADLPREWTLKEFKNLITLAWESIVPYRIGEFRNYEWA